MLAQKSRAAWWRNSRGEWYVVVQSILFVLIAVGPGWIDVHPQLPAFWHAAAMIIGLVLGAVGLLLAFSGMLGLGSNLSIFPRPKDNATLVQTGAYGVVRHPIYAGLIIGAVGWALLNVSLVTLIYAGILLVFFDVKSRREERWLTEKFPDYAAYRTRVRKLIPFVY
ncbi:MAG TPA: isoprenylcysteine carboxylmethyltransferase family protein [Aggregatilineaceae bacterium]|jgi:protein-S-isoprenylcysteine O-methyltransferase Ste14|nr:isoprenylcysteine carboxylmethyltransferase family protein [Aggregatilineaceae bacterium]